MDTPETNDPSPKPALAEPNKKVDRRRQLAVLAALDSAPRWKMIEALRGTNGKTIKALTSRVSLTHSATSEHARRLRRVGILRSELADEEDLRSVYQRLNEKLIVTEADGRQWLDLGSVKVCLD